MKPSTIACAGDKTGFFATQAFAEGEVVQFYYDQLIYETMLDTLNAREVYEEGVVMVTRKYIGASEIRLIGQYLSRIQNFKRSAWFQLYPGFIDFWTATVLSHMS